MLIVTRQLLLVVYLPIATYIDSFETCVVAKELQADGRSGAWQTAYFAEEYNRARALGWVCEDDIWTHCFLINGFIPLIAVQLNAIQVGD